MNSPSSILLLSPFWTGIALFGIVFIRYLLLSGGLFLWFWRWRADEQRWRKITPRGTEPDAAALRAQITREIRASAVTSALFALAGTGLLLAWDSGLFPFTLDFQGYGWPRAIVTLLFLVLGHETYFYFTHRWMHQPRVFAWLHRLHHESRQPTPFAAFAFHWGEGVIQALALPLLVAFVPVHPFVLLPFLLLMTVTGTLNHLGYEVYPRGFASHGFWKYWISATHHQAHHERVNGNYGLYFTFWDRWLGTERPGYVEAYDSIQQRRPAEGASLQVSSR